MSLHMSVCKGAEICFIFIFFFFFFVCVYFSTMLSINSSVFLLQGGGSDFGLNDGHNIVFISGFGPDAMSLVWPAVVQLVVFCSYGVCKISHEHSSLFTMVNNMICVFFSMMHFVRESLCELCNFVL